MRGGDDCLWRTAHVGPGFVGHEAAASMQQLAQERPADTDIMEALPFPLRQGRGRTVTEIDLQALA